jgi:group I intron endonuclease
MKGVIYCYHCIPTGKKYIGQTIQEEIRKYRHSTDSKRLYCKFYNAVNKYGWENFIYGIIGEYELELLNEKEIYYINEYNTYKSGYNMTLGGNGRKAYDIIFDSIKEYYKFYRQNNVEELKIYQAEYYQKNKEKKCEYEKNNRERKKEYMREYHKKWRENNREKAREYCRKCYHNKKQTN